MSATDHDIRASNQCMLALLRGSLHNAGRSLQPPSAYPSPCLEKTMTLRYRLHLYSEEFSLSVSGDIWRRAYLCVSTKESAAPFFEDEARKCTAGPVFPFSSILSSKRKAPNLSTRRMRPRSCIDSPSADLYQCLACSNRARS